MNADPRFDLIIERQGTHCAKWDMMEKVYGVSADDGLAMWVADMDFRPPQSVQDAAKSYVDHGIFGYFGDDSAYREAITWWMQSRHDWTVDPAHIFSTHGLVNGTAMCLETFSKPGDGIVLFTPVYHAFARVIEAAERTVIECQMVEENGRYHMDFDAYDAQMTGDETMVILCSPHNPGGRVWTRAELEGVAAFARRHDLIIVSDEIHHDILMPGAKHTAMANIEGIEDRLLMMSSTNKTFNLSGTHIGNVIIADDDLRARFQARMMGLGMSPNAFGLHLVTAAYSPQGAEWVDALNAYLDGNRKLFDAGVNAIPGVRSMPLEATYLSWVDFSGTGMDRAEVITRIQDTARIAANHGPTFGSGGENFMRFNLATPRARIVEAVERMQDAFSDLQ